MFLAQVMRKIGEGSKALRYAYDVLQSARNDQKAVLRYFGLIMMDPDDGPIHPLRPSPSTPRSGSRATGMNVMPFSSRRDEIVRQTVS